MTAGYRLVVFDWDGTLLDSVGPIVACTRETLRELGLEPVAEERIRSTIGLGIRDTVERLCPGCDEALFRSVVEAYRRHWLGTYRELPMLFAGAAGALEAMEGEGYLLAVATGKSRKGLDHELRQTGLRRLFAATRTVDDAPSKPHPGMLLGLMEELGVRPPEALMVGDTVHDLEMARSAGVDAVAVLSGTQPRETLETSSPRGFVASVAALPAWLGGSGSGTASGSPGGG